MQEAADGDDVHEQFQRYCDSMAGSAVWGGQAELGALAHVLRRRIDVFSVGMPTVAMGEEYTGAPLALVMILALWICWALPCGGHVMLCIISAAAP